MKVREMKWITRPRIISRIAIIGIWVTTSLNLIFSLNYANNTINKCCHYYWSTFFCLKCWLKLAVYKNYLRQVFHLFIFLILQPTILKVRLAHDSGWFYTNFSRSRAESVLVIRMFEISMVIENIEDHDLPVAGRKGKKWEIAISPFDSRERKSDNTYHMAGSDTWSLNIVSQLLLCNAEKASLESGKPIYEGFKNVDLCILKSKQHMLI